MNHGAGLTFLIAIFEDLRPIIIGDTTLKWRELPPIEISGGRAESGLSEIRARDQLHEEAVLDRRKGIVC